MSNYVFLNGNYYSYEEARVPLEDRGFLFGDGVYEVIRIYSGRPFLLDKHLQRLQKSADQLFITLPSALQEIATTAHDLIAKSGIGEGKLYIQLTRGAAPRAHEFPVQVSPTFFMLVREMSGYDKEWERGVKAILLPDERWGRCHIKSLNLLPNVLAKEVAKKEGAFEAFFLREGVGLTEGASSNVFAVIEDSIVTAPEGNYILSGITRDVVLEIAGDENIAVQERYLKKEELLSGAAAEIFLTSTVAEVMPVITLNNRKVGSGSPGQLTRMLQQRFNQLIK